jgi:pyridoxal phosphate enzyme (YggS family)
MDESLNTHLGDRLQAVEARLRAACRRAGRAREEVTLVAITKTVSSEVAGLLADLGVRDLGESRPQELWHKAEVLGNAVRWHLVGHWQRNKIERTLPLVCLAHSIDSLRLLDAVETEASRQNKLLPVLLQVNASREPNKHGFLPEDLPTLMPKLASVQHVHIEGLMTMAALAEDPNDCRPTFALLRELRDQLRPQLGAPHHLQHLSMGMTNDFEVAVEEGATLVRLGSILFEGLPRG